MIAEVNAKLVSEEENNPMKNDLQYADLDYRVSETARKVAQATGCTFGVAASCVSARGGDFKKACQAVRDLRMERGR